MKENTILDISKLKPGQKEKVADGTTITFDADTITLDRTNDFSSPEKGSKIWSINSVGAATLDREGRRLQISTDARMTEPGSDVIHQDDPDYCSIRTAIDEKGSVGYIDLKMSKYKNATLEVSAFLADDKNSFYDASIEYTRTLIKPPANTQEFVSAVTKQIKEAGIDSLESIAKRANARIAGEKESFYAAWDELSDKITHDFKDIRPVKTDEGYQFVHLDAQGKPQESVTYDTDGSLSQKDKYGVTGKVLETTAFDCGNISKTIKYYPDSNKIQMESLYLADGKTVGKQCIYTNDGAKAITYAYGLDGNKVSEMNWKTNVLTTYEPNKEPQRFSDKQLNEMISIYKSNVHSKGLVEDKYNINYNRFLRTMKATFDPIKPKP